MQHETILILDFGSQYTQLIARRLRELNVYCEIHPWNKIPPNNATIKGDILSGVVIFRPELRMESLTR